MVEVHHMGHGMETNLREAAYVKEKFGVVAGEEGEDGAEGEGGSVAAA